MTVTYSKLQYIPRTNELVEDPREVVYAICPACEYVSYNIPRREDDAHDELCCGAVPCSQPPNELCVTHDWRYQTFEGCTPPGASMAERMTVTDEEAANYLVS